MKFYAGIGSRSTPTEDLVLMTKIAKYLDVRGYTLRSGGAAGADTAFKNGSSNMEIFYANDCTSKAMEVAKDIHPKWNLCSEYVKKLHGRNAMQILGRNLDQWSDFVICWTPDGCIHHNIRSIKTGGTGTAISIASTRNIPVFNLNNPESKAGFKLFLTSIK